MSIKKKSNTTDYRKEELHKYLLIGKYTYGSKRNGLILACDKVMGSVTYKDLPSFVASLHGAFNRPSTIDNVPLSQIRLDKCLRERIKKEIYTNNPDFPFMRDSTIIDGITAYMVMRHAIEQYKKAAKQYGVTKDQLMLWYI